MALTDPQSVTIAGVATSLPRVGTSGTSSTYQSNDGAVKMTVSHQNGKRNRHLIRLEHSKIAPDPLVSSTSIKYGMACHLVIDTPLTGYTVAQAKEVTDAFMAFLTASSGAVVTRALGNES